MSKDVFVDPGDYEFTFDEELELARSSNFTDLVDFLEDDGAEEELTLLRGSTPRKSRLYQTYTPGEFSSPAVAPAGSPHGEQGSDHGDITEGLPEDFVEYFEDDDFDSLQSIIPMPDDDEDYEDIDLGEGDSDEAADSTIKSDEGEFEDLWDSDDDDDEIAESDEAEDSEDDEDWEEDDEDEEDDDGNALYYPDEYFPSGTHSNEEADGDFSFEEVGDEEISESAFSDISSDEDDESRDDSDAAKEERIRKALEEESFDEEKEKGFVPLIKSRFKDFKKQAKAELHGKDSPEDDEEEDGDEEEGAPRAPSKIFKKIDALLLSHVTSMIAILSKMPILGSPLQKLSRNTRLLKIISKVLPIIYILALSIVLTGRTAPSTVVQEFPDRGALTVTNFSYQSGIAKGTVKNTGDVSLYGTPEFKIYSSNLFNPISWFKPGEAATCTGELTKFDIDATKEFSLKCTSDVSGFRIFTSGTVN